MAAASLDSLQANVFIANLDFEIVYINDCAKQTLSQIAGEIRQTFGVEVDDIARLVDSHVSQRRRSRRKDTLESPSTSAPGRVHLRPDHAAGAYQQHARQQMAKCRATSSPGKMSLTGSGWNSITPARSQPSSVRKR